MDVEGQRLNFPGAEWERSGQVEEGRNPTGGARLRRSPSALPPAPRVASRAAFFFFFFFLFTPCFVESPIVALKLIFRGLI